MTLMSHTRSLSADLASLNETIAMVAARTDIDTTKIAANLERTRERLQDVEFLVPGLYDYSGTNPFLVSVRDQVHLGQKPLTQKQIDAVRRVMPVAVTPKVTEDVNAVLRRRERNAIEVIRNSGRVRQLAKLDTVMANGNADEGLYVALNSVLGRCPDGCCGGAEMHETYLSWVQEVELLAASVIEEDAG